MEYQRKCIYCGKGFVAHSKKKVYCSKLCADTALRLRKGIRCNPSVEAEKKICSVCGKEFETRRKEQVTCSHECSIERQRRRPRGGHKAPAVRTKYEGICIVCNAPFTSWWNSQKTCGAEECKVAWRKESQRIRNERAKQSSDAYIKRLEREWQKAFHTVERECIVCGSLFYCLDTDARKTCSHECSRRRVNRTHDKRIPSAQIVDRDITNDRLFKRDNGRCWLCGGLCDWNDRKASKKGRETFGDNYPSIDHVIPVSMGGLHSWDNVRLAHLKCNQEKSDTLVGFDPMPVKIAYREKRTGTQSKKTIQMTLEGEVVRVWDSTAQIKREMGWSDRYIQNVCRGDGKTAFGFKWKYA